MSTRSSHDELPKRSTTKIKTFLETFVLDADHKALKEHLEKNQVHQNDLDRCLLRGIQIVQQNERELSEMAEKLTILLQFGAKWNNYVLLGTQKTPYHTICKSPGDHHQLLRLMIKSSKQTIINRRDGKRRTALIYAVLNANINCLRCLIRNRADTNIGDASEPCSIIKLAICQKYQSGPLSVIRSDIFDLLVNIAVRKNKNHFKECPEYLSCAVRARNVYCINKLIKMGAPLKTITDDGFYVWTSVARMGDVELLKCLFNHGLEKESKDQDGVSILGHVVASSNIDAVRYVLDQGADIPVYTSEAHKKQCKQCNKKSLIIYLDNKQRRLDPCMIAIHNRFWEIAMLLDERGSQSCKSLYALSCAVVEGHVSMVSYLLNKYTYPLNTEYFTNHSCEHVFTVLTESLFEPTVEITKLLLDHGADPVKPMCSTTSPNALMTGICCSASSDIIAQFIRSGVNINVRSWNCRFKTILSAFEASVMFDREDVSLMLLISGSSRGVFNNSTFKVKPKLEKMMKEWNLYDNNVIPLKQRCRRVILNHLSPQADMKIKKLPLPTCLIKFLGIPELEDIVC